MLQVALLPRQLPDESRIASAAKSCAVGSNFMMRPASQRKPLALAMRPHNTAWLSAAERESLMAYKTAHTHAQL